MVLSSYFGRYFGGSFAFFVLGLWTHEISNDGSGLWTCEIFNGSTFPYHEKLFTYRFCKDSYGGIGYRRALIGYLAEDWRRSRLLQTFLLLDRLFFGVLKQVEFW
ncbi:unnamed protein product [Rhizophagus irregularis]|nr:unnamed protein product [Rhizophagus irregularis]